ncbi:hypothetical protein PHG01_01577 [Streptococcus mutans PKUSS-HG01]|nr:hypothetical protein PHG01_01577 [Streptococcus mutans PKUSS-HG01]
MLLRILKGNCHKNSSGVKSYLIDPHFKKVVKNQCKYLTFFDQ